MLTALYVYLVAGVVVALLGMAEIRYRRWLHDTGRKHSYSPNKDSLGYFLAATVAIPGVNLIWIWFALTSLYQKCFPLKKTV